MDKMQLFANWLLIVLISISLYFILFAIKTSHDIKQKEKLVE